MKLAEIYPDILNDIRRVLGGIGEQETADFLEALSSARRVYVSGSGRSLFVVKSFAQRLYHCGIESYASGDTNIPPAGAGDLMVACSSSGATLPALCSAERAKESGSLVAAVTSNPSSRLAKSADMTVLVPLDARTACSQPLGSLFEQSSLLFFDCVAALLMKRFGLSGEDLKKRHCNLE